MKLTWKLKSRNSNLTIEHTWSFDQSMSFRFDISQQTTLEFFFSCFELQSIKTQFVIFDFWNTKYQDSEYKTLIKLVSLTTQFVVFDYNTLFRLQLVIMILWDFFSSSKLSRSNHELVIRIKTEPCEFNTQILNLISFDQLTKIYEIIKLKNLMIIVNCASSIVEGFT